MSMFLCGYGLQRKTIEIRLICEQLQIYIQRVKIQRWMVSKE